MNHNLKKRLLALLLLAAMIFPSCAADETSESGADSADAAAETEETAPETTLEDLYPLPVEKYDGKTFDILVVRTGYWGQDYNDIYMAEDDVGDTVGFASYQRALEIETEYDIKFVQSESADATGQAKTLYNAGDTTYELIQSRAVMLMPGMASAGMLADFMELPGMNLDAPWYNQSVIASTTVANRLYMIGGDATVTDKTGVAAVMFNKSLAENLQIPDLYQTVYDGKWTLDLLGQYAESAKIDENGDGKYNKETDTIGLIAEDFFGWNLIAGAGYPICLKDENDIPYFTSGSESVTDAMTKIQEILYNDNLRKGSGFEAEDYMNVFSTNHALFHMNVISTIAQFRDMESDFGIIPLPKYTETQEAYLTTFSPYVCRFMAVPVQNPDVEFIGNIVDLLYRMGTDTVKTAFYDVLLSGKIARDQTSTDMLDLVFGGVQADIGAIYNWGNCWFTYQQYIAAKSESWVSTWKSIEKSAEASLKDTIEQFTKITEETAP